MNKQVRFVSLMFSGLIILSGCTQVPVLNELRSDLGMEENLGLADKLVNFDDDLGNTLISSLRSDLGLSPSGSSGKRSIKRSISSGPVVISSDAPAIMGRIARSRTQKRGGGHYKIGSPYHLNGVRYVPKVEPEYDKIGIASWYGPGFHTLSTANGEAYDQNMITAAHPTLPLPSYARVTNLENNRSIIVRINDRGPFRGNRIIDLSKGVAQLLNVYRKGTAKVRVQYLKRAPLEVNDDEYLLSSYQVNNIRFSGVFGPKVSLASLDPGSIAVPVDRPEYADSAGPDSFAEELKLVERSGQIPDDGSTLSRRLKKLFSSDELPN